MTSRRRILRRLAVARRQRGDRPAGRGRAPPPRRPAGSAPPRARRAPPTPRARRADGGHPRHGRRRARRTRHRRDGRDHPHHDLRRHRRTTTSSHARAQAPSHTTDHARPSAGTPPSPAGDRLRLLLQGPRDGLRPQPARRPGDRRARAARPLPDRRLDRVLRARARSGAGTARVTPARRLAAPDQPRARGDRAVRRRERADLRRGGPRLALEALRADHGSRRAEAQAAAAVARRAAGDLDHAGRRRPSTVPGCGSGT